MSWIFKSLIRQRIPRGMAESRFNEMVRATKTAASNQKDNGITHSGANDRHVSNLIGSALPMTRWSNTEVHKRIREAKAGKTDFPNKAVVIDEGSFFINGIDHFEESLKD